jgi:hypothetical protein
MQVQMQGRLAHEWAIRGLQPNQYYATADDAAVPLQVCMAVSSSGHSKSYAPSLTLQMTALLWVHSL